MAKDSKKVRCHRRWGFGRFINDKPADEAVHNTCFFCHETVKARDFVFAYYAP
jgi:Cytochrome P460